MLEYLATMETADDRTRFESLYLAYRGLMYHVAYHILKNPQDAEDAVHQSPAMASGSNWCSSRPKLMSKVTDLLSDVYACPFPSKAHNS